MTDLIDAIGALACIGCLVALFWFIVKGLT